MEKRYMRIIVFFILAFFSSCAYSKTAYLLETVAEDLDHPWSVAFLPDGDYLVTLRGGELHRISADGKVGKALQNTPDTYAEGQGGYFDVLLDPDFTDNNTIYLSFAFGDRQVNSTRVVRATLSASSLQDVKTIYTVRQGKDTSSHFGGRMVFINDGTLVITTGDGFQYREAAQDPFSQLGKIIRINKDGSVPDGNPFADGELGDPKVYTLGHRSPQGLSYDPATDTLYMHEHGPKGGDEVNIVKAGANYGWPATSYGVNYSGAKISPYSVLPGIEPPIIYWTPSIAPSGLAFYDGDAFPAWKGSLFVGALVYKDVRRLELRDGEVKRQEILFSEIGERIRDVRTGPDGYLYILTDSKKGKMIRVRPAQVR